MFEDNEDTEEQELSLAALTAFGVMLCEGELKDKADVLLDYLQKFSSRRDISKNSQEFAKLFRKMCYFSTIFWFIFCEELADVKNNFETVNDKFTELIDDE